MQSDGSPEAENAQVDGDWLRGVLPLCLLALCSQGESYGYDLGARLAEAGIGPVAGGSLYPALVRLEGQGLLVSEWRAPEGGRGRKYYRVTDEGVDHLRRQSSRWAVFARSVAGVLDGSADRPQR
ncbi:MAG: PadR family transcriptional regulator [Acidimicrobiales bacterium]|nr:PadR family transcriptional regulator [Acidimicrobiales bacterium]